MAKMTSPLKAGWAPLEREEVKAEPLLLTVKQKQVRASGQGVPPGYLPGEVFLRGPAGRRLSEPRHAGETALWCWCTFVLQEGVDFDLDYKYNEYNS